MQPCIVIVYTERDGTTQWCRAEIVPLDSRYSEDFLRFLLPHNEFVQMLGKLSSRKHSISLYFSHVRKMALLPRDSLGVGLTVLDYHLRLFCRNLASDRLLIPIFLFHLSLISVAWCHVSNASSMPPFERVLSPLRPKHDVCCSRV